MIKVLSILQPWASLVVSGHKRIETRSWNTKYRGELYIHASMGKNYKKLDANDNLYRFYYKLLSHNQVVPFYRLPFGAIIGKVDLVDTNSTLELFGHRNPSPNNLITPIDIWRDAISEQELAFGDYSDNRFGWLLANPVKFKKPIPAKGQLGIWNYDEKLIIS